MKNWKRSLLIIWALTTGTASLCLAQSKSEALKGLNRLKLQNQVQISEIDKRLYHRIKHMQSLRIKEPQRQLMSQAFNSLETDILQLKKQKKEFLLRQDLFDRMLFQVDNFYREAPLSQFLYNSLKKMALIEAKNPDGEDDLWKFFNYLAIAINNIPERNEDVISFIEGYIRFSTITNPTRPDQYVNLRDYTNGSENYTAETVSQDSVGGMAERQLEKTKTEQIKKNKSKVFELRQPILKGANKVKINTVLTPKENAYPESSPNILPGPNKGLPTELPQKDLRTALPKKTLEKVSIGDSSVHKSEFQVELLKKDPNKK